MQKALIVVLIYNDYTVSLIGFHDDNAAVVPEVFETYHCIECTELQGIKHTSDQVITGTNNKEIANLVKGSSVDTVIRVFFCPITGIKLSTVLDQFVSATSLSHPVLYELANQLCRPTTD